ncbi:MAG: hypothetical protein IKZ87_08030 [Actinomycetaceae bacterium]|nr:hypothetical protein [Actinomycetaceae bacterium]
MAKKQQSLGGRLVNIFLSVSVIFFVVVIALGVLRNAGSNNSAQQPLPTASPPVALDQEHSEPVKPEQDAVPEVTVPASREASAPTSTTPTLESANTDAPSDETVRAQLEVLGSIVGVSEVSPGLRQWELIGTVASDDGPPSSAHLNIFQIGRFLALGSVHDAATGTLLASSVGGIPMSLQDVEQMGSSEVASSQTATEEQDAAVSDAAETTEESSSSKEAAASAAEVPAVPASTPAHQASDVPPAHPQPSAKFGLDGDWIGAASPIIGELEKLPGVVVGEPNMKPQDSAYIFFDPRCPYCKETYKTIKANWPKRRVKWIPAVILGESPDAYATAASLLDIENGNSNLDKLMTGRHVVTLGATDEQKQQLLHNATTLFALMQHMDPGARIGVPAMYWSHRPTGQLAFASGASQQEVLAKVFGPSNIN